MRYSIVLGVVVAVFLLVCGSSEAWSPYGNESPPPPNKGLGDGPELPFDPNDYAFLIYDCNGGEDSIDAAMEKIGIDTYTVCDTGTSAHHPRRRTPTCHFQKITPARISLHLFFSF